MTPPDSPPPAPTLADASAALAAAEALVERVLERAREITRAGDAIDAHQVLAERVAYAATEARAARALVEYVTQVRAEGRGDAALEAIAGAGAAELSLSLRNRLEPAL